MKKLLLGMALLVVVSPASVLAAGSDDLWEMTTRTDMPGMAMPAVTHTVCMAKNDPYKPEKGPNQNNCEMTDIKFFRQYDQMEDAMLRSGCDGRQRGDDAAQTP